MRILVTGGSGFIGSNLVDALLERGDDVVVIDNLSTGRESNLEGALARGAVLVRGDIRDAEWLYAAVEEAAPAVVFHLAAQIDVRRSVADPAYDARTNVEGTINVLEAARRAGAGRVVNISTGGAIYGEVPDALIPTPETHEPAPMAPYGNSKYCAERYCRLFGRLHGSSVLTLRLGNVYGPRQDPLGEAGVIAIFCGALLEGGQATIFGDGTQTRDYVHVSDVVRAALAAGASQATGEINVGTGRETSVLEIVAALNAARPDLGGAFSPTLAEARTGEIQRSCLNIARAREELGYEPAMEVTEGIAQTLASL